MFQDLQLGKRRLQLLGITFEFRTLSDELIAVILRVRGVGRPGHHLLDGLELRLLRIEAVLLSSGPGGGGLLARL